MADTAAGGLAGQVFGALVLVLEVIWLHVRIYAEVFRSLYLTFVPPPEKSVAGEVVVVTGAGHGIGREVALKYASLGAVVVCMDINEKGAAETVKDIKGLGAPKSSKAAAYKCDVSDREDVLAVAKRIAQEVGPVTVLVNNAGIMPTKPFLEHSAEELRRIFDINMTAHFWAFLPSMMERQHGHVVAVSSMCGQMGTPNLAPYCASKYAVRGFMESLVTEQYELRRDLMDKVRFTTIYPYMVNTGLVKSHSVRFNGMMPILNPTQVGEEIVSAMRRNEVEVSIPSWLFHFNRFMRLYPPSVAFIVRDFLQVKIEGAKK